MKKLVIFLDDMSPSPSINLLQLLLRESPHITHLHLFSSLSQKHYERGRRHYFEGTKWMPICTENTTEKRSTKIYDDATISEDLERTARNRREEG